MANREIKFRAWYAKDRIFVDIYEVILSINDKGIVSGWIVKDENDQMEKVELQEFTGLKDKHGKEIYEGDIVTDTHGNIGEVSFDKAMFYVKGMTWIRPGDLAEGIIIGNIYENSELLEVKTK